MEQLRRLFTALGFSEVETFIASGNVIFVSAATDVRALERKIEAHLEQSLGYVVATFVRSLEELSAIARHEPFGPPPSPGGEKVTTYIILLAKPLTPTARKQVLAFSRDGDELAVKGREIYWRRRGNLLDSPLTGARLERTSDGAGTMRNRNTIVRLATKYPCV
jgi:uncharacterized protein (DUF1697 family)